MTGMFLVLYMISSVGLVLRLIALSYELFSWPQNLFDKFLLSRGKEEWGRGWYACVCRCLGYRGERGEKEKVHCAPRNECKEGLERNGLLKLR